MNIIVDKIKEILDNFQNKPIKFDGPIVTQEFKLLKIPSPMLGPTVSKEYNPNKFILTPIVKSGYIRVSNQKNYPVISLTTSKTPSTIWNEISTNVNVGIDNIGLGGQIRAVLLDIKPSISIVNAKDHDDIVSNGSSYVTLCDLAGDKSGCYCISSEVPERHTIILANKDKAMTLKDIRRTCEFELALHKNKK
jgi:hypothetical protein